MTSLSHNSHTDVEYDWRQCAQWLNRCRILPDDHPSLSPNGNGLHVVQTLMDGVAICNLLSTLTNGEVDPRTMKDFSARPQQSQFLCCRNIRIFTNLCEKEFNINSKFLIEPDDLYHAKNFGKVIELLSKISKCQRAQISGIKGFPSEDVDPQVAHEYYNTFTEIAASSVDDMQVAVESNYADVDDETNEIVYDSIVHGSAKTSPASTEDKPMSPRSHCIKEILSTEKHYVELLRMLLEKYKQPLSKVLSVQELDEIFKFIDQLYYIHRELLSNLSLAMSSTLNVPRLGDVFLKVRDHLLIYGEYCGHVSKAQTLVLEIMKNDMEKRSKIETCQSQSENYSKFNLTELLTVPMQRVLKYHLLLEQLGKLTDEEHPEKPELLRALAGMRELAQTINEVKRDLDTVSAIDQIQASLLEISLPPDKKLSTYGRRHIDGELRVFDKSDSKSKIRYVFLFDKVLLLCKSKGGNYTFMEAYHVSKGRAGANDMPIKKTGKYIYEFEMPISGEGKMVSLVFAAKSEELRSAWIKAVETALGNLFPPGAKENGYQFEMHTFKQTTYCCFCNKLLQGVFYQGYRCRESELAAHKACLATGTSRLPILHPKNGVQPPICCTVSRSQQPLFWPSKNGGGGGGGAGQACVSISRNASSVSNDSSDVSLRRTSTSDSFDIDSCSSKQLIWPPATLRGGAVGITRMPLTSNRTLGWTPFLVTALTGYSGEPPPPPLYSLMPHDPVINEQALIFNTGDRILLTQPPDGSRWLHGRINDQNGCFPASNVELPFSADSAMGMLRRQSEMLMLNGDRVNDIDSLPPPPFDLEVSPAPVSGNGAINRSLSVRSYFTRSFLSSSQGHNRFPPTRQMSMQGPNSVFDAPIETPWYVGTMERTEASNLLSGCANGTFLVRISKNVTRMGEYSLSVVYKFPRHIRISRSSSPDGTCIYYLCKPQRFASVTALIEYYSRTSLNECFDEVQTTLRYPYQRCTDENVLFYVRAIFDYEGNSDSRMLSLSKGDFVAVCSTHGDERGWWKGWLKGRVGFFPRQFVVKEQHPMIQ